MARENQLKWIILFVTFFMLTVIDIAVPDPLPVIDEVVLILATYLTGRKIKW